MAQAIAKLKTLAAVFGLCEQCEIKLTGGSAGDGAGNADARRPLPQNGFPSCKSTIDGVQMEDCDLENVVIKNCRLTDVTFEKCRLRDVTFDGSELTGFTYLTNVRVKDTTLPGYVWSCQEVENACAGADALACMDGCSIAVSRHIGSSSKTRAQRMSQIGIEIDTFHRLSKSQIS
ncbi:hypothetical protein DOTSEDRAFT_31669 [Dothistroma septosporum NZE10]|uniref:Pentapeptide repeat-containing protein n=1 Tax=Dothistroma septosporum (strain NZE10 / CBS 128990) TaxID=675120 RepID=N1PYB2_DOTSN|nr:hypothetical protein DOTSEDRAFT_31669 [Dothistroma septosporum NZE10]